MSLNSAKLDTLGDKIDETEVARLKAIEEAKIEKKEEKKKKKE